MPCASQWSTLSFTLDEVTGTLELERTFKKLTDRCHLKQKRIYYFHCSRKLETIFLKWKTVRGTINTYDENQIRRGRWWNRRKIKKKLRQKTNYIQDDSLMLVLRCEVQDVQTDSSFRCCRCVTWAIQNHNKWLFVGWNNYQ